MMAKGRSARRQQARVVALRAAAAQGCTCAPAIHTGKLAGLDHVRVGHDPGCAALAFAGRSVAVFDPKAIPGCGR